MVHLAVFAPSADLVSELLATRSKRELQSVIFDFVNDAKVAALAGELVATDPHKQWKFEGGFHNTGAAFCGAASRSAQRADGRSSSLTHLRVEVQKQDRDSFATLLAATPALHRFDVRLQEVTRAEWIGWIVAQRSLIA